MLFVQLTDLHVRPYGQPACRVVESNMMVERALRAVANLRPAPEAVLITGDLTDCGLPEEYERLAEMLPRFLPMPVFAVPGNHDRRENMIAHLPGTPQKDGFVQYTVEDFPVRFVMLDTVVPGAGHGELCDTRLAWLDHVLAAAPDKPTVIGMHHPPFVCGIGHMDRINLWHAERFIDIVARHRQVEHILCGHHHRPIVTRIAHAICSIAPSVAHQTELDLRPGAPSALVLEPPGYQILLWSVEAGLVSHTALVESFPGPFPFVVAPEYPGRKAI